MTTKAAARKQDDASPERLLSALRWRYATKKFDSARKIPRATWEALEEALVLAPSSFGLQPWKFLVVEDPAVRARLRPVSWGQSQVTDADKLVVFAARKGLAAADVERFIARTAEIQRAPLESLGQYKQMMLGFVKSRSPEALHSWTARQTYLALGVFLASAAALGVDACPMEGIEPAKYDEILGLSAKGYTALCIATAGYRAADDAYAVLPKVRFEKNEVVERV